MLVWRAASSEECAIGQLDIDAAFLNRLDTRAKTRATQNGINVWSD
jgi:hypothetical protein